MSWTVNVLDVDGYVYGTLGDDARIGTITTELNGPGVVTITLPTTHDDAELLLPGREVQILLDDVIMFWGVIVRPQAGLRSTTWQIAGLSWYFQHRFMGRADRVNLLLNGSFEDDEDNWTFDGALTHSINTDLEFVEDGVQSLKLEGSSADHTENATQSYTVTVQYHPLGDAVTVAVRVWVPSPWVGGALNDRGLVAKRIAVDTTVLDEQIATIDENTPLDQEVSLEVVLVGVHATDVVEVRLYPPHGVAYFDLATATLMESLSLENSDVATIISQLVGYGQDRTPPGFTHGKSDLNIDVDADATTVIVSRVYLFSEHRNIWDAISEFVRQGIVDIDFVYTETTRTLTVYHPAKGSLFGTTLELDVNLADFTYSWDGERAASSVVVLGPGDGPDRPEGGAVDPAFLDGLSLEIVESAPDDVTIRELDAWAAETLDIAKNPQILEVTTLPGTGIIGAISTGDTASVLIQHGWVDIDAIYRVVRIAIDPYEDQATLTLNVAP